MKQKSKQEIDARKMKLLRKRYKMLTKKLELAERNYEGIEFDQAELIRVAITNPLAVQQFIKDNYPKEYYAYRDQKCIVPIENTYPYERLLRVLGTVNPTGHGGFKQAFEYIQHKIDRFLAVKPLAAIADGYTLVYDYESLECNQWYIVATKDVEEFNRRMEAHESFIDIATTIEDVDKINIYSWGFKQDA